MAVTAYKTPSTCANADRDGKLAWANFDNAKTSNDVYADATPVKNTYSDWLRVTKFGFSTSDIPSGATIQGIEAKIERKAYLDDGIEDSALYLRKTSGQTGSNKASATNWPTTEAEQTYGGAADMWGTTLVDTEIRSDDFGLDLSILELGIGDSTVGSVDCISIRVHYTEAVTFQPWAIIM